MINNDVTIEKISPTDHCLYFKLDGVNYRLSPWSKFLQCAMLIDETWHPLSYDSGYQLLQNTGQRRVQSPLFDKFIESVPKVIQARARRFSYRQHIILKLMRYTNAAVDLADSNPILLWLIADRVDSEKLTYKEAKRLIIGKQGKALKQLFPDSKAVSVRFTKRMLAPKYSETEFRVANELLQDDSLIDSLKHCKQVNLDTLRWFLFWHDRQNNTIQIPFIKRLIASKKSDTDLIIKVQRILINAVAYAMDIGHGNPQEALRRCSTFDQLRTLCEHWKDIYFRDIL